jgi:BlaI family transcriptional regulator, penicillinase repressor
MKEPKETLGDRELDIMQVLWRLGPATVADVQNDLHAQHKRIAYTTIQTMLNRLETKKLVARDTTNRVHRYHALLKQPKAVDRALKRLTQRFFDGSAEALVTRLVEKNLNKEQLERIQSLIDSHKQRSKRE